MKKFLRLIVLVAALFVQVYFVPAQEGTNFATWKNPQNASSIPDWVRRMLVRDFRDLTGDARTKRLETYLSELNNIVIDANVVPPTRYNAILAIGQLVSEEASPGKPPSSYSAALPYLVDVYQKNDSPAYLKYGALLGIVRHANCGIDSDQQDDVINLLLKIVKDELGSDILVRDADFTLPSEPAIWDWFRQTALDGLSALKTTGTNGNVVNELLSVMNQKSQELEFLCQSNHVVIHEQTKQIRQYIELASKIAKTLGDLDYKSAEVDAKAIAVSFIRLCKTVCDVEHKIASESLPLNNAPSESALWMEQIVIDIKTCSQSIAWGIRCGFLTGKPTDYSFYASQQNNEQVTKQLDSLWKILTEISVFLDEGDKVNRPQASPEESTGTSTPTRVSERAFKFDFSELDHALVRFSEALTKI